MLYDSTDSSSDDGGRTTELVEIFSGSTKFREVLCQSNEWTPESMNMVNFINRRLLRGDVDYPVFLELILMKLMRATSSEFGNVTLKNGNKLRCIALGENHLGSSQLHFHQEKSIQNIFGYSINTKKTIISNDVPHDPRIQQKKLPQGHPKITTLFVIPIRSRWLLSLANKSFYDMSDVRLILPLVQVLARILEKTELYKETVSRVKSHRNAMQNRFLAAMSHDLRTPLNGILGMVTLLPEAGNLSEKQMEYVTNIKECTFQMVALVNNFLDFNKMTSESLILKREPFKIEDAINDALSIIRGSAVNKGLKLSKKIPRKMPVCMGDRARLTQVLSNLLSNAVKFTEKGKIEIRVNVKSVPEEPEKRKIIFNVKDTGIGIPSEDQERIFEFFRQSKSLNAFLSRSGTGFGLSFSRELVRLMDGKISVKSRVGKGSTFTFYILLEEEIRPKSKSIKLEGKRVLIVDDRSEIRLQLSSILFQWGCIPITMGSAEEALQYLSHESNFNLGMIDICMPNMSGIQLAQELRRKYPKIPLIGISSAELLGGEEYFDYYTYKPIDQNQLFSLAIRCINTGKNTQTVRKKKKTRRTLKILIAEDNNYNSYTLRELLVNLGYKESNITIVNDGKACVAEAKSHKYDVILMDILMPIMDGIDASKEILSNSSAPMIIAVSAAVMNTDKTRCQGAGISGYLEKPITKEKLDNALLPLIAQKKHKEDKKSNQNGHRNTRSRS